MYLKSFRGYDFESNNYFAAFPDGSDRGQFSLQPILRPRSGQITALSGATISERTISVELGYRGASTFETAFNVLVGKLEPTNTTPGTLVAVLNDATEVSASAIVTLPSGQTTDGDLNYLAVTFVVADPVWRKTSTDSYGPLLRTYNGAADSPNSLAVTVNGYAPAMPLIKLTRAATDPALPQSYRHRRSFTLTNNGTKTWRKHPIMVNLGDMTSGWTGASAETVVGLYQKGTPKRRQFVGFGLKQAYLWLVVDNLAPGKALTYDLVWTADSVDVLSLSGSNAPAIDRSWWNGNVSAGTSTSITTGASTFETNQWLRATVRILTGPGAGEEQLVSSSTATVINISGTWTVTPTSASTYLLYHSANDKWTYAVRQTERTGQWSGGTGTGLYWINKTQSKPDDSSSDIPGGWFPYSFLTNRDDRNQETEGTPVNVGTLDYFAILDADRSWQGNSLKNSGSADGLMFSSPREITQWRFNGLLKNPNGIAKGFFGSRSAGSIGWTSVREETTAADTLTAFGTSTYVLDSDTYQLVMALLPADEVEIPLAWSKDSGTATTGDSGTATSGSATTLNDTTKSWTTSQWVGYRALITAGTAAGRDSAISANTATQLTLASGTAIDSTSQYIIVSRAVLDDATKEWATNQWVNARVRITDGRGEGASAVVTANTATKITAAFGVNTDSTSRYQITNKHLVATLRTDSFFYLVLDASTIGLTSLTADASTNNRMQVTVRNGGGVTPAVPYQRVRTSVGRLIWVADTQELRIDCATKRAGVYVTSGGALVEYVTDAVVVDELDASGNVLSSPDWMKLPTGANTFYMDNASHISANLTVITTSGYWS